MTAAARPLAALAHDPVTRGLAVLVVGFGVALALAGGAGASTVIACWVLLAVVHAVMAWESAAVARTPDVAPGTRRVWTGMAVCAVVYLVGDLVQVAYAVGSPLSVATATGSTAQNLSVLGGTLVPLLAALTLAPSLGHRSARARRRLWLDVSIVMVAAVTFGAYGHVPAPEVPWVLQVLTILIGPGLFLVVMAAVARLVLSPVSPFSVRSARAIGAAATLQGVLQAASTGTVLDRLSLHLGLTVLASALLALSARVQHLDLEKPVAQRTQRAQRARGPRGGGVWLPYLAVAATYLLLLRVLVDVGLETRVWFVVGGAVCATSLVIARQLVTFGDNARLLARLDTQVEELRALLSERDRLAGQLRHEATHDYLTGLANRSLLSERLDAAIERLGDGTERLTLMVLDLNDFKDVNDRHGHAAGDDVLMVTARRLRGCVREEDLIARLGGDEFAVLVEDLPGETDALAHRVATAVAAPVVVGQVQAMVSASIGVVSTSDPARTAEELLRGADTAMYQAKRAEQAEPRVTLAVL